MKQKLIKALLLLVILCALLAAGFPVMADTPTSGTCGDDLTWNYAEGVLTISGYGEMYDYNDQYATQRTPWYAHKDHIQKAVLPEGIETIGNYAFSACDSLTEITLPEGVATIGEDAFSYCNSLTEITLPKRLTTIGDHVFYWCNSLTEITLPEGITTIGELAFSACHSLTEIALPEGVTTIGEDAFSTCSRLTEITLPKSLIFIDVCAFSNCSNLLDVYYAGTRADWEKIEIYHNNDALLYANLHTVCDGAEISSVYTDNKDGTHTVAKTCSDCGGSMGNTTEDCKDLNKDGLCDGCKAIVVTHEPEAYELRSLTLRDSSGKTVTSIPAGSFYAEAKVKKLQDGDPVLLMLVTYTADGQMLSTAYLQADVPTGSTYSQGCHITNNGKVGEVKAFLASSLGNPAPIDEALSVR